MSVIRDSIQGEGEPRSTLAERIRFVCSMRIIEISDFWIQTELFHFLYEIHNVNPLLIDTCISSSQNVSAIA